MKTGHTISRHAAKLAYMTLKRAHVHTKVPGAHIFERMLVNVYMLIKYMCTHVHLHVGKRVHVCVFVDTILTFKRGQHVGATRLHNIYIYI